MNTDNKLILFTEDVKPVISNFSFDEKTIEICKKLYDKVRLAIVGLDSNKA